MCASDNERERKRMMNSVPFHVSFCSVYICPYKNMIWEGTGPSIFSANSHEYASPGVRLVIKIK